MVHLVSQQTRREKVGAAGGNGTVKFLDLFTPADTGDRTQMCAAITLEPGCSVGIHSHTENGEIYMILEGEAVVTEDGKEYVLHAGDAEFCADGHTHGIENRTDKPMVFLGIIVPNK